MDITIGKLAKKFGLSRSTLLYYDSIGLLSPTCHHKGEYRFYSEEDQRRLGQICQYRKAGIPLKEIQVLLDSPDTSFTTILEQRFADLNLEISKLYEQQRIIASLLKNSEKISESGAMTKELWTSLLEKAGYTERDMYTWHITFEQTDPEKHHRFLQHLQIPENEIATIRGWGQNKNS